MKMVVAFIGVLALSACSAEKTDAQRRRDVESFVAARDTCLDEIAQREKRRHAGAGFPEMTAVPSSASDSGEGEEHQMHLEYKLPGVEGAGQFNEAECTAKDKAVVKLTLKH